MVSDPRLAFLKNHEKYSLKLDLSSGGVVLIAAPLDGIEITFYDAKDAHFDLTPHLGVVDNSLVWGVSGLYSLAASRPTLYINSHSKERWLRIAGPEDNPVTTLEEINLDKHLDIVEEYVAESREVRRRFGLKPTGSKRSIVLCFDGTSNHFSNQNTNVVKLVELLKKDDPSQQMVYYQPGIGTYSHPGFLTSIGSWAGTKLDEGIAWYLYQHVIDGYKYLMQVYRAGDQISIFGFSRGAYTARALAGMLHSVGLLPRHNIEQVPFAYHIYERWEGKSKESVAEPAAVNIGSHGSKEKKSVDESALPENVEPARFKMTYCTPVEISFLGVWDTVGSVGIFGKPLPWIEYNPSVKCFRQALALDENRGNFIPMVWDHSETSKQNQDVLEVWFKGGHADIGGGADPAPLSKMGKVAKGIPERLPELSNIALRWMIRQYLTAPKVFVLFDPDAIQRYRKFGILEERGAEAEAIQALDDFDLKQDPYIALEKSSWWKVLEWMPVPKLSQRRTRGSRSENVWSPNKSAPRAVNHQPKQLTEDILLHSSVYRSIRDKGYTPAAKWFHWPHDSWPFLADAQCLESRFISSAGVGSADVLKVICKNMECRQKADPNAEDDE